MGALVSADPNASPIQLSPAQAPDRAASTTEGVVTLPGIGGDVGCVCGGVWSVGDQVVRVAGVSGPPIGSTGTVVCGQTTFILNPILVCWDGFGAGHDGNGFCACPGEQLPPGSTCGWYVECADIVSAGGGGASCVCDAEFEVGDKVELLEDFEGGPVPGSLGTVICGREADLILVYWEDFLGGHDGFGECDCPITGLPVGSTSGWYVPCDLLASFKCPKNINVDLSPGTAAPPASLGPYLMTAFPADTPCPPDSVGSVASPLGGSVGFSMLLEHRNVSGGPPSTCGSWGTWSHGYTGDVYFTGAIAGFAGPLTLMMPPDTGAFYFYVESNAFGLFEFVATANDGTSTGPILVEGSAGARYIGFYAAGGSLNTITITQPGGGGNGFAVGEFGIAPQGQVIFDGSPGTAAPPAMLGPYVMSKFAADTPCPPDDVTSVATPLGQPLFFSDTVSHRNVGGGPPSACGGWGTWSHDYTGDVYFQDDADTVTLIMPPQTGAFYLYVEPNNFGAFEFVVETDSGTSSGTVNIEGSAGASYFGFWGAGGGQIVSITVTNTDGGAAGFAVGEFGIAEKACNKTCPADLNGDGVINGFDLALLLGDWTGAALYAPCPPHVNADLNGDCRINGFDLALLLGLWGPCEF